MPGVAQLKRYNEADADARVRPEIDERRRGRGRRGKKEKREKRKILGSAINEQIWNFLVVR